MNVNRQTEFSLKLLEAKNAMSAKEYDLAGQLFESLVTSYPEAPEAWCGLADLAIAIEDFESALPFIEHASQLRPEATDYLQRLGEVCLRLGLNEDAIAVMRRAAELVPDDVRLLSSLGGAYVADGQWGAAKEVLAQMTRLPEAGAAHFSLLGLALQHQGELDEAEAAFLQATEIDPDYVAAWVSLGELSFARNNLEQLRRCAEYLVRLQPMSPDTLELLAMLELSLGSAGKAAMYLERAARMAPDSSRIQARLTLALVQSGEVLGSIDAMERALELGVSEEWILEQLGFLFAAGGQMEMALESLEMLVERRPDNISALNILCVVYIKTGQAEKAKKAFDMILEVNPNHVNALINLGGWYSDQGRSLEAVASFERALELEPKRHMAYTNALWALVHGSEFSARQVLDMACRFDENLCRDYRRQDDFSDFDRTPGRRLRVGWVTSDMREHPVAAFVLPFLACLDGEVVESIIYSSTKGRDGVTDQAKTLVSKWRDVRAIGDDALADLIRADRVDILVDLNGNTDGNRLPALARKPAPIMLTWLGFPATTGMSAMDYILVPPDPALLQPGWSTETPWPLPDCYGVRTNMAAVPVLPGLPCEDKAGNPFTFGCLNNLRKVSEGAVELWSEILKQAPGSRLALVGRAGGDETVVQHVHSRFARYGVGPEQIDLKGMLPPHLYLFRYNQIDLGLDPFPFNGGTTGYDSIWMGVPFVTLPGEMLVSRMGKAILENVGLGQLVASDAEAYVQIAVDLWKDRETLKKLRMGLRETMQASPLMDARRFARGIEKVFQEMWLHWCSTSTDSSS